MDFSRLVECVIDQLAYTRATTSGPSLRACKECIEVVIQGPASMGMQVVSSNQTSGVNNCVSCPHWFASTTLALSIGARFTCVVVQPLVYLPCVVGQPQFLVVLKQLFLISSASQLVPFGYQPVQDLFSFSLVFNQNCIGGLLLSVSLDTQFLLGITFVTNWCSQF